MSRHSFDRAALSVGQLAKRRGVDMGIDRFLRPDNIEKSELFQNAIEWILSRKEQGDAPDN
jgi:hypothetical protein